MKRSYFKPNWNAERYEQLSIAQKKAAAALIDKLGITNTDEILDVGCGSGGISSGLSKLANKGFIHAIDISIEMINYASRRYSKDCFKNLEFMLLDANRMKFKGKFDKVFSSYALQWIEDKNKFLQKAYVALKKNGILAFIMPFSISFELEKAIESVIGLPMWSRYFTNFHPGWHFLKGEEMVYLLEKNNFEIISLNQTIQSICFSSREEFVQYLLLWFPYLTALPNKLHKNFLSQVLECYFSMAPVNAKGMVTMRIPQLEIISNKSTFDILNIAK